MRSKLSFAYQLAIVRTIFVHSKSSLCAMEREVSWLKWYLHLWEVNDLECPATELFYGTTFLSDVMHTISLKFLVTTLFFLHKKIMSNIFELYQQMTLQITIGKWLHFLGIALGYFVVCRYVNSELMQQNFNVTGFTGDCARQRPWGTDFDWSLE